MLYLDGFVLISHFLLFPYPEPPEASPPRQGGVPVLCADTPGAALHVVLREREDDHEASREHGGGGVRLPLSNRLGHPPHLEKLLEKDRTLASGPEDFTDLSYSDAQSGWTVRPQALYREVQLDTGTEAAAVMQDIKEE